MNDTSAPGARPRLITMDAMRGFAIFGIFMVNIQVMGMPFERALDPHYADGANVWAWALTTALFESNFVAIFSMLFGAGLILQMNSAMKKGVAFGPVYLRRLGLLMLMGLAHGVLLFLGDILFLYSIVGLALFFCRKMRPRTLLIIGAVPLLFSLVGAIAIHSFGPMEGSSDEEIARQLRMVQEGPLSAVIERRTFGFLFWMILSSLWFNWRVLSMLFLGAALMKLGFFEERRRAWHVRAALFGLTIGGALEVVVTWSKWEVEHGVIAGLTESLHQLSSLTLALGYMGAISLIVHSGALGWLVRGLSAVGRTSLSNYILQSVVANLLFTFIGLAWFGVRTRWELMGIVCVTYAIQIAISTLWLRHFRMGPLEWVWRSWTYLRWQPLMR